jgi:hypothetical protein
MSNDQQRSAQEDMHMPATSHAPARAALRSALAATAAAALLGCSDAVRPLGPSDADAPSTAANSAGPLAVVSIIGLEPVLGAVENDTSAYGINDLGQLVAESPARPFRLTAEGNANPDFSQGPCNVLNTESGTGVALHLGKVTWTATEVASFCVDPANPGLGTASAQLVVTAANGDQLTASGRSTVQVDVAGGTLTITGRFTITGGTGRFAGASGGGTVTGGGSLLPPFAVATTFEGQISY